MDLPGFWFDPPLILRLRHALQKPKSQENFWAWHFTRRGSIYLTVLLSRTRITPNQVTVASIWSGVLGGVLWGAGTHWSFLVGALSLQTMYLLDCVDGELARIKNLQSPKGAYLDLLGHYLVDYCMIMGMGIGLSGTFDEFPIYVAIGLIVVYLGDELLRDVLLKARVKSGKFHNLDALHKSFSFSRSTSVFRTIGKSIVGSPGFFTGVLVFSLLDMTMDVHYLKFAFFLLWGSANLVKFTVRFLRILRTAFQQEMV